MDNNVILITVPNKTGYVVNISNPKIEPLYNYFKKRIKSPNWPISDKQRYMFERIIVNLCRSGAIRVRDWVIHCDRINAWNKPKWLEYDSDIIPVDDERGLLYSDVRDEIALINKALFWKLEGGVISSDDMAIIERIELTDTALANIVLERIGRRKDA